MRRKTIESCICKNDISVIDAMSRIQDNAKGVLYVVDDDGGFIGSVTDGDIRRWIISTGNTAGTIAPLLNREAVFIWQYDDVGNDKKILKDYSVRSIPVLDEKRRIVDIIFDDFYESSVDYGDRLKDSHVIIMAGGKGTRLYPYTKILPKPLIPIGDVPIIERIMNQFNRYGASSFFVVVNYKKEMIKSYFIDSNLPYNIQFIDETEPLGTAGGIRLIEQRFNSPVIITNCDTLIEADYDEILEHHNNTMNDMTIVSSFKNVIIPYGVLEIGEEGKVDSMQEKPRVSAIINTGMYVLSPDFIDWIPMDNFYHMTDLAQRMLNEHKKVGIYPVSEKSFLDMGQLEEMKKMEYRISSNNGTGL